MDKEEISKIYGGKVRVRVCGILVEGDSILLVKHKNLGKKQTLWMPPGGGVEFGQSISESLKREFLEETGLFVEVCDFLFASEFIQQPLHAIELFFKVELKKGTLKVGIDPEAGEAQQIIDEVRMMDFKEINSMNKEYFHGIFLNCSSTKELLNSAGFFNFENNL
ncbi:NUDIX hydrolase [Reichenbachiella sp. MALMAid0571]|uniref:NUDIX hydrolase n=1 Tax=Reichenbachiella sp. MALMAid0571 TaxID=3143939 RepID=UPI0032DE75CD